MARTWLIVLLAAVTASLLAPLSAQARTPCPNESAAPTALNGVQVSDAIFCLTNQIRAHYGLPALRRDTRLDAAATLHSLDMGNRLFFAHNNPEGLTPTARAAAQGYTLGVGENIAYGYANARAVVLGWVASVGHCKNILGSAIDLGVGTVVVGTPHYSQEFGDWYTRPVDPAPRDGCPYTLNLDTLNTVAPAAAAQPAASPYPANDTPLPSETRTAQTLSLRSLELSSSRFRAGDGGTTISYTLSAPATVTFRIQRASHSGHSTRYRTMTGRLTHSGVAGVNRVRFTGRIGGSLLRPGRYRLQAVATDVDGTSAPVARTRFKISR
ncbi:MAG TPA: CAP domain-containing protein [Solirubrobacteraceae bacterium]|nr:CAP domain-containing protein [Solirubrobacteraceae bacterium]